MTPTPNRAEEIANILVRTYHMRPTTEDGIDTLSSLVRIALEDYVREREEEMMKTWIPLKVSTEYIRQAKEQGAASMRERAAKIADGRNFYDPEGYLRDAILALPLSPGESPTANVEGEKEK